MGKMRANKNSPLTDYKGFLKELQNESPRAAVIIASAFLDAQLRKLLSNSLIDNSKIVDEFLDSDLRDFSYIIKMAYCMGLISESIFHDLNVIRKIRNKFAHEMHGYSFDEPEIVSWCKSLKQAKMIVDAVPHIPNSHNSLFVLGVTDLAMSLGLKILETEKSHKSVPKNPELDQVVIIDENKRAT
jgi:DNA-binding MltR family transcriptional regulator